MTTQTEIIPGYQTGTWNIDPTHSEVAFVVRHLGLSKVRGTFDEIDGTVVTADDPLLSEVTAVVKTASVNTRHNMRDDQVRAADFLDVETYPLMTFASTAIRRHQDGLFLIDGELTLRGISRPVTLKTEVGGFGQGNEGTTVAGFSATTEISRIDFGITGGAAGAVVSDRIKIVLEIRVTRA